MSAATSIGRVGGLAVALGVGTAVLTGHGVAWADDGSTGSGSKTGTSSATDSAAPKAATSGDKASTGSSRKARKGLKNGSKTSDTAGSSTASGQTGGTSATPAESDTAPAAADDTKTGSAPWSKNKSPKPQPKPKTPGAQQSISSNTPASTPAAAGSVPSTSSTAKSGSPSAVVSATAAAPAVVAPRAANLSTLSAAVPTATTTRPVVSTAATAPAHFLTAAVSGITTAVSNLLAPFAGHSPTAPARPGSLEGFLSLVRRELDSLFRSKPPTISYDAAQTLQMNGAILGQITTSDPNGDNVKLRVSTGPANGTVTLFADGSFKYVPNPEALVHGGTDSFTVTASDLKGDPLGLNVMSPGPHTTTKVVTVSTVAQTSPLATATEISTEQRALALLNSGAMDGAIAALKQKWINTQAVTFSDVPGGVDAQNMAMLDAAVRQYAMYSAMAAINIADNAAGNPSFNWIATPPHTIGGVTSPGNQVLYDNPDTLYRMAFISDGKSYVIHGKINGQMPPDVNITAQIGATGQSSAILTGDQLQVNPDGTFTIVAGRDPALAGTTNYLFLGDGPAGTNAGQIFVRNTVTDWNTNQGLSLTIEQTSGTNTTLPSTAITNIANGVVMQAVNVTSDAWLPLAGQHPVNTLPQPTNAGSQTLSTQKQSIGHFNLADNEALVITLTPGTAKYFNVPVTNAWTISPDYTTGDPTSLNNAQAIANPDGSYTLVVAKTDPGVANWVSTGGLNQGTIFARWQGLDPNATVQPTLSAQVVTLDELKTVLPKTTVYVTEAQRAQQIAERQSGYTLRTAPYVSIGGTTAV
ncbi:Ig-like domain-containing protein [Mycobacterium sp. SMC-17]|uniref:Ig-like domain-containing protein n=1 Tax=Mycobacterium sp. SMC-17 TaxID=3381628 RepID=UPI0038760299